LNGVIFDLDGTLLDSMDVWDHFGSDFLRQKGIEPTEGLDETLLPMMITRAAEVLVDAYPLAASPGELVDEINRMIEGKYRHEVLMKPHVQPFLKALRAKGVKMCVATLTDRYLVEAALGRLEIAGYFDFILTCTEVGFGKDRPDIFEQALARLGTGRRETFVFEDSVHAAETAKAAGFPVIGVCDRFSQNTEARMRRTADIVIEDFSQAMALL
jgi:HAD superfamily hydrolase (TIGR01509 family)